MTNVQVQNCMYFVRWPNNFRINFDFERKKKKFAFSRQVRFHDRTNNRKPRRNRRTRRRKKKKHEREQDESEKNRLLIAQRVFASVKFMSILLLNLSNELLMWCQH